MSLLQDAIFISRHGNAMVYGSWMSGAIATEADMSNTETLERSGNTLFVHSNIMRDACPECTAFSDTRVNGLVLAHHI